MLARVRELREARGDTQEAFAERAGLKYKHYQRLDAGRSEKIYFETFVKLAKGCEMEPWELLHAKRMDLKVAEAPGYYASSPRPRRRKN